MASEESVPHTSYNINDEWNAHFGEAGAVGNDPGSSFGQRMTGLVLSGPGQRQD